MKTFKTIKPLQKKISQLKEKKATIGFVPTMGALHAGHLSLIKKARRENDIVILSIFVNPKQFGPKEDFSKYPRVEKKDKLLAKKEKVDIIFYPSEEKMYPTSYLTFVNVDQLSNKLCGQSRPGHFRGVTTVVCKLLNIVNPDTLYLGQKDAQQSLIIARMIKDLNFLTKIRICPIVRETDGLAMSSRNAYLSPQQRKEAPVLFQSLKEAKAKIARGETTPATIINFIKSRITNSSSGKIDYIQCVNTENLESFKNKISGNGIIALAVKFGKTRLIDNIAFHLR